MAAPLYPLTKNGQPFHCGEEGQQACDAIKQALLEAPALGLPDDSRPFHLYVTGNRGTAKGVLTQWLGPWKYPVAYLLKKLDPVTVRWPACLWIVAEVVVQVKDAGKLTLGQDLTVTAPHDLESVVRQPRTMTDQRPHDSLTDFVAKLRSVALNVATLLPNPDLNPPAHDCQQTLAEDQGRQKDLSDQPRPMPSRPGSLMSAATW